MQVHVTETDLLTHNPVASALARQTKRNWHASDHFAWIFETKYDSSTATDKFQVQSPYIPLPETVREKHEQPYTFEFDYTP